MTTPETATLSYDGKSIELPVIKGDHVEKALDVRKLRAQTGWITLDPGYADTAVCKSAITHIDGEKGVVLYRGYDLEELAEKATFVETAMLIMFGELPTRAEREEFRIFLYFFAMLIPAGLLSGGLISFLQFRRYRQKAEKAKEAC